jgi:hypothetical protein
MNIITPNTSPFYLTVRTQPTESYGTFAIQLNLRDQETLSETIITNVTASYDSNDFLNVTASVSGGLRANEFIAFRMFQLSGSSACNELYRGEILPTTMSATVHNSEPLFSYTGANDEFIIY